MKKKILITAGIISAIIALFVFNSLTSRKKTINTFAEVKKGLFEITVTNSGELIAENSIDIKAPELGQTSEQEHNAGHRDGGTPGGGQRGGSPGGGGGGGGQRGGVAIVIMGGRAGTDMRAMDFKILDIVPEGTIVKTGDYVAQLDRTNYDNTLKDELEKLTSYQNNLGMKILDTAMTLTSLRDDIKNQRYVVEEAEITLDQARFEPPATIRKAETNLNKQKRDLEQQLKNYDLKKVQAVSDIKYQYFLTHRQERLVTDLQDFLARFRITAPSDGMVIYKKDRNGTKRKAGSSVNAFDRTIATLPDLSSMISKIYVNEIEVSKVRTGQKVNITVDAFPDKTYYGSVTTIANIGEQLPNSDAKMFEVIIKMDGSDISLRPAMTTWNKIIIKTIDNAVYIPLESVQAGADSIPFVYKKNHTRQIVLLGEQNDKSIIVKEGLSPGTNIYLSQPEEPQKFRVTGENLIASIRETR